MGRKKKTFYKPSIQIETGNDRYDNQAGRIEAINSWDDIEHDSEDEYYEKRGKILLDNNYSQKQDESESSEEEVFALQTGGTSSEDESQGENQEDDLMSSDADNDFDGFDSQTWGNHKKTYYDADELSDFDEAKEEEEEALRLQKKRISKMSEEDFFDDDNLLGVGSISAMDMYKEHEKKLMERLNQEVQKVSFEKDDSETQPKTQDHYSNLSRTEIVEILQDESPELIELLSEFKEQLSTLKDTLTPILEKAKMRNMKYDPALKFLSIKYHTLLNYLTNISFYFFLKSSGTRHLRIHPVIDTLVDLRTTLDKLETLESKMEDIIKQFVDRLETDEHIDKSEKVEKEIGVEEIINELPSQIQTNSKFEKVKIKKMENNESIKSKRKKKLDEEENSEKSKKTKLQNGYIRSDERNINLSNMADTLLEPEFVSFKNVKKNKRIREDLDMGDLDTLDDVDAEDKAQNRKSLRHHVAKIDQNLAKREKAIRLGGDTDIPYKDKDKNVIKLVNSQNNGDDLDNLDWNEDDNKIAKDIETGGDDELYLSVRKTKKAKKEKEFEHEQLIENSKNDEIVHEEEMLPDGSKRQINYEILKNKGLTPHRKKEQRNPRVKHRNKYEKAKKKIKSIKRIVVRQEGPYGGEITGIKTKLSRSIKFND